MVLKAKKVDSATRQHKGLYPLDAKQPEDGFDDAGRLILLTRRVIGVEQFAELAGRSNDKGKST